MAATKPVLSWHSDVSQFMEASSEEIVNYCAQPSVSAVASCQKIRRLSETLVVKFGFEVTESEYKNQLFVYDMLANKKIKVARPYRFFRAFDSYGFSNGYLVMEYVRGQRLDVDGLCNDENTIEAIASAIQCLHATSASCLTQQTSPGPLFGSVHRGFPWGDGLADGIFDTIEDLERCIQNRLRCVYRGHAARSVATTGLSDRQMVLCHLDLAPRNLLLTVDGTIAVLDWASMAWFPAAFELASLEYLQAVATADEAPFFRGVKAYLQKLSPPMEADISLLGVVHANSIRYTF